MADCPEKETCAKEFGENLEWHCRHCTLNVYYKETRSRLHKALALLEAMEKLDIGPDNSQEALLVIELVIKAIYQRSHIKLVSTHS